VPQKQGRRSTPPLPSAETHLCHPVEVCNRD
jgi:hypothetical protein